MHQSRPYGLHAIGLPLTDKDEVFISNVTARITNLKAISGVSNIKMVYDLPDGGYAIVQDAGGNFRVISHKPFSESSQEYSGIAQRFIPMLYSGVVLKAAVYKDEAVPIKLTEATRHRLRQYDVNTPMPAKEVDLQRFRVPYGDNFSEFKSNIEGATLFTQYGSVRPTWYSGAMSEAVQLLGGYGRQDLSELPDNDIEQATLLIPNSISNQIFDAIKDLRLPGYSGIPHQKGSIQYDYKFNNTDAIGFDDKTKPWLLKISASGVWAMPLPIIPATAHELFKSYIEEVDDQEVLTILNRFGAMPSGETFPTGPDFEAWRKAGVIIKICDASDFYTHSMYGSACGWSMNSKGTEGYNTCYDYEDNTGLAHGFTYKLRLRLASSAYYYGKNEVVIEASDPRLPAIQQYLTSLIPKVGATSHEARAILFKIRRVNTDDLYQRALSALGGDDIDYWRNLELEPIANHIGSVNQVYKGYLYHPANFLYQPQIKFPEPLIGACISFDFLPNLDRRYEGKQPNCDTIMFAYFVGDTLKTIKYFVDWSKYTQEVVSNFETNMRVGSWEETVTTGYSQVKGYFYSSDIDDRQVIPDSITTTNILGEDKGYDSKPYFAYDYTPAMAGTLWRHRYFTHKTNVKRVGSKDIDLAVAIPYFCRNTVLQPKRVTTNGISTTESLKLYSVRDPYSYRYWTFDDLLAWTGMTIKNPKGNPSPVDGSPVWVEEVNYNPLPSNNFADSGDWIPNLPADYTSLIHPDSNVWVNNGGGGAPTVQEYVTSTPAYSENSGAVSISMANRPDVIHKNIPDGGYYRSSPSENGFYFYKDAVQVVMGNTIYRSTSESSGVARSFWGSCSMVDNKSAHIFIGVINE